MFRDWNSLRCPALFKRGWLEIQKDISSLLEMPHNVGSTSAKKVRIAYNACMKEAEAIPAVRARQEVKTFEVPKGASYKSTKRTLKAVIESLNGLVSNQSKELARGIVSFEAHLAELAKADAEAQRKTAIYTSLRRLNEEYPTISLSTYFLEKHLIKKRITLQYDTKIYIAEPEYVENVFFLLRKAKRYQIKNYVGWRIIATLAPFVIQLREHHQKFMDQYGFHEKKKQDICVESVAAKASPMRHLLSKMYVERKFSLEAKKNVQMMSEQIERALLTFLSEVKVEDPQSPTNDPKSEMTKLIGYPDWMDDEDAMEERFSNVRNFTEQSPFVRIYEEYRRVAFDDLMKKLSTPYSASNEYVCDIVFLIFSGRLPRMCP
ncbi:hypothetical protein MRX96_024102 [Rhipicephalus microplus]